MRLTRLIHSCVLVEDEGETILFDPGNYSWNESAIQLDDIEQLSCVLITHSHGDHFSIDAMKAIVEHFPAVRVVAPDDVVKGLKEAGIQCHTSSQAPGVEVLNLPHEALPPGLGEPPENWGFNVNEKLTNPGDSLAFTHTLPILLLPVTAPFLSYKDAIAKVLTLDKRPRFVVPIHDWHWKDEARQEWYSLATESFAKYEVEFLPLDNFETQQISL